MARKRVLLINPTIHPDGVALLESQAEVVLAPDGSEGTLIDFLEDKSIEALIARVEIISKNVIEGAAGLRVIGQHGAGLDNIDVKAAADKGIKVLNAPGVNAVSVAEHVILLMLGISRRIVESDAAVRNGDWAFRNRKIPVEMNGKTLFLLGLGAIGRGVAQRSRCAFNMKVYSYDPLVSETEMRSLGVEKVEDLADALPVADYISVHVPLMEATRGMLGAKEFEIMKEGAYVVNTSRGPIIDEQALVHALREGRLAGAALDVFEKEPPSVEDELLGLPNVILTPHFGGDTVESKKRTSLFIAKAVLNALS